MKFSLIILVLIINLVSNTFSEHARQFPKDFMWGVASSSYQIEGGWNADGKGESIWDNFVHNFPHKLPNNATGDIACDSYNNWKRDVQMIRELGVKIYRFSISWPRILPSGYVNIINKPGIDYYNNLINELLRYNITPAITIYHWELPQRMQEIGGWMNAEIVHVFEDYAKVLFDHFADRVKMWITINEPWHVCEQSYAQDYQAPAYNYPGIPGYLCGKNVLKAHAEVVHLFRRVYKPIHGGSIGIVLDTSFPEPKSDSPEDLQAAKDSFQFYVGHYAHPIFSKEGNYPQLMIDRIGELSKQQGFARSRLPPLTKHEIKRIQGTADFFGINSYTSFLTARNDPNNTLGKHPIPSFAHDAGIVESYDPTWTKSSAPWLHVVPFGMYKLLSWINKEYNNPPVIITENGVSDCGGTNDIARVEYFNSYLEAVLDAIEDGCNVIGYFAWSLMDSFEWRAGYSITFGLYHVDFTSPDRTRTAKASAKVFSKIVKTNKIDWEYRPFPDVYIKPLPQHSSDYDYDGDDPNGSNSRLSVHLSLLYLHAVVLVCRYLQLLHDRILI